MDFRLYRPQVIISAVAAATISPDQVQFIEDDSLS
jgi:hypothetical protein